MLLELIVPTIVLVSALVIDVRTHKIPNKLVLVAIVLCLLSSFYFYEFEGLKQGALAAGLAILMTLPLVLIGALGAGDMKLMFAFGLATTYSAVFSVLVFSFFWAVFIGVALAVANGQSKRMLNNIITIVLTRSSEGTQLQRIPYTIPLFLGWVTFVVLGLRQGGLL